MNNNPVDYTIEILQCAPGASVPQPGPIDITGYCLLDSSATINRAVERDLLSFKTGDMTLLLKNDDGFFDDLFAFFGPSDHWQLRIFRRGDIQFWGLLIGKGSIKFDRSVKRCEITAYGLTKMLNDASAETVKRTIADMTVTTATGGASTITVNSTSGLLTGDVLHVTDHVNSEDITIKQVTSGTVCSLEATLAHSYASGSPVQLTTPFYRYKSPDYLVRALFTAASIPIAEVTISGSLFGTLAPTPVNLNAIGTLADSRHGIAERNGLYYAEMAGDGSYYQTSPDADWVKEDATDSGWQDWSHYYTQVEAKPTVFLRFPVTGDSSSENPQSCAFDWKSATKSIYFIVNTGASTLRTDTTTNGTTWAGSTLITALPFAENAFYKGVEFDPVRNLIYCAWNNGTGTGRLYYWDVVGAAWTNIKPASDGATVSYFGPIYVPEKDYILVMKATMGVGAPPTIPGPNFTLCAFRGSTKLWERAFPSCLIGIENLPIADQNTFWPSRTIRMVGNSMYAVFISDGAVQFLRTDDEWQTYIMRQMVPATSKTIIMCARVLGQYRIACYVGTTAKGHFVAAPFYAGVVPYAGFSEKSCAQALQELGVLTNSLFWVDDDSQGHFVARDLYDPGNVTAIEDRILSRIDDLIWDETAQFASVSGGGFEAVSGNNAFAAEGISISSDLIPNTAFAQALADAYASFYTKRRIFIESETRDGDGLIYHPLDRVTLDGIRYLVYESDHDLPHSRVTLKLLEDV